MIIIALYRLADKGAYLIVRSYEKSTLCPKCHEELKYRDSRKRIHKREGKPTKWLIVRRLYCEKCRKLHTELPDCVVPQKHYEAAMIRDVIDGVVTDKDDGVEFYPDKKTMNRWKKWFEHNKTAMNRYLSKTQLKHESENNDTNSSMLEILRENIENWLELVLRSVYDYDGKLEATRI